MIAEIDRPRTSYLKFSPKGNYLIAWETFHSNLKIQIILFKKFFLVSKDNQKETSNLNIFETKTGNVIKSIIHKQQMEKFVEWTDDEKIFVFINNGELLFFETSNPGKLLNSE